MVAGDTTVSYLMALTKDGTVLAGLEIGLNSTSVFVKVAHIIHLTSVCYPLGPDRPMIEEEGIHMVVFDNSMSLALFHSPDFIFCVLFMHLI